jgi:N-acetylneuraminate synthase
VTLRIVAEISANHLGSLDRALRLIDTAAAAGADAVKFQTYTPEAMVADPEYQISEGPWIGRKLAELYAEAHTPPGWHSTLFRHAKIKGIEAFSSVFDIDGLELLEALGCPRYKIASFELVDLPLIRAVARTGKPMILSTGMASKDEIQAAKDAASEDTTLLKCTSGYPTPPREVHLAAMVAMGRAFACPVGLSDHTLSIAIPAVAVTLGASVIEKHLTLRRDEGGPDAAFSLEPHEFAAMVKGCREAKASIGWANHERPACEAPQRALRRSLFWAHQVKGGKPFEPAMARTARPALGLPPAMLDALLGRIIARVVRPGEPVREEDFEPST